MRITQDPIARIESTSCEVWYSLSESRLVSREKREAEAVLCYSCVRLNCYPLIKSKELMQRALQKE